MPSPRLFVTRDLAVGGQCVLSPEQTRYLSRVLRLDLGAKVRLFNGRDGEFEAALAPASRDCYSARLERQARAFEAPPDLRLLFAPVKRQATDWLVEKATELGVVRLQPVITKRTVAERVRIERLNLIAQEACEQCERLETPAISEAMALGKALDDWDTRVPLLFADEAGDDLQAPWGGSKGRSNSIGDALLTLQRGGALAVLVGPEGGFDPEERRWLRSHPFVCAVSLGPRILRAETAAVAALSVIQSAWGDWRSPL